MSTDWMIAGTLAAIWLAAAFVLAASAALQDRAFRPPQCPACRRDNHWEHTTKFLTRKGDEGWCACACQLEEEE